MKASLILEAVNRMTGPVEAALRSVRKLSAAISSAGRSFAQLGGLATQSTSNVARSMTAIGASATKMGASVAASTKRASAGLLGMYDASRDALGHFRKLAGEEGMGRAARSAAYLREQVSGLTDGLTLLKYASVGAGIGLAEEFVRGVFKAGGEMEQMLVTLTKLEGSESKARASMAWMQSFGLGAGAAFSMPDIMRSFQMATNFGMNPMGGSLTAFTDFAAGERRPLQQVLYAVKDAMEGTSTRPLANLGIKMTQGRKPGEENTYLYSDRPDHFVRTTSAKTPEAVLEKLVEIINSKYAGLASAQAQTVPGGIAQMQKLLYLFEGRVAGSGVFDWALRQMNVFFAAIRRMSDDGSLDRLAKQISNFMTDTGDKIIAFVRSTDWAAVGKDVGLVAGALVAIGKGLNLVATLGGGGISGLLNLFVAAKVLGFTQAILGLISPLVQVGAALVAFEFAALPIEGVIIAVAALAAAGWLIYANWGKIGAWWQKLWGAIPAWAQTGIGDGATSCHAAPGADAAGRLLLRGSGRACDPGPGGSHRRAALAARR